MSVDDMKIVKWIPLVIPILLVIIVLGTYFADWDSDTVGTDIKDFYSGDAQFAALPKGLVVPDSNPYYALMATPIAIHYNQENTQEVIPLLINNATNPSTAIDKTLTNLGITPTVIHDTHSLKDTSLALAEQYWEHTTRALLIEPTQDSYTLAVNALPLASYFSMPVILTNSLDDDVTTTLKNLGVQHTMVIGNIKGYKDTLALTNIHEIMNITIDTVTEKFGDITYITLTNPQDAWLPEVLDTTTVTIGPEQLRTRALTFLPFGLLRYTGVQIGSFMIPDDYKYALVKFEGINLENSDTDELGDSASFM